MSIWYYCFLLLLLVFTEWLRNPPKKSILTAANCRALPWTQKRHDMIPYIGALLFTVLDSIFDSLDFFLPFEGFLHLKFMFLRMGWDGTILTNFGVKILVLKVSKDTKNVWIMYIGALYSKKICLVVHENCSFTSWQPYQIFLFFHWFFVKNSINKMVLQRKKRGKLQTTPTQM